MSDKTKIEWTDATWNPTVGCAIKSPGCINCYAMRDAHDIVRRFGTEKYRGLTELVNGRPVWNGTIRLEASTLDIPYKWKRPRKIFVNSMSDLFYEALSMAAVDAVVKAMDDAPWHTYQILTKRPDVMRAYGDNPLVQPRPNWWMGVSIEDQARADERRDAMSWLAARGWNTWISYEPAIGAVDWRGWEFIKWMVSGGESGDRQQRGKEARPTHPQWHRDTRDWCADHGIPYNFKQWGDWLPGPIVVDPDFAGGAYVDTGRGNVAIDYCILIGGSYGAEQVGKKKSGRLLDGIEHNGFPA